MLFKEPPIAFPWYEKLEQQNRYMENVDQHCDFKLISPKDALLPFELARSQGGVFPQLWEIFEINSQNLVANISASISQLRIRRIEGQEYYVYDGAQLMTGSGVLNLAPGYYFSRLYWSDNVYAHSEMFVVPNAGAFNIQDDDYIQFIKLSWWNDADLRPIFYNDKRFDGTPHFKNVLYIDTFITASEPEILQDGVRDGNDETIPTFEKAIIKYRITLLVPDFLKKALAVMQMHDHIMITTKLGVRSGEVKKANVATTPEANGAYATVDILFQETILLKKNCGDNMAADCDGAAPTLNPVEISGSDYIISGTTFSGAAVRLYKKVDAGSEPVLVNTTIYTSTELASGITLANTLFTGYNFIAAGSTTFGCDFGFSNVVPKP